MFWGETVCEDKHTHRKEEKVWKLRLVMGFHPSNNVCYEGLDTCTLAMLIFNAHKWCTFQHFCKVVRLCEEWRQALKKPKGFHYNQLLQNKNHKTHQTEHMHIFGVFHLTVNMKWIVVITVAAAVSVIAMKGLWHTGLCFPHASPA